MGEVDIQVVRHQVRVPTRFLYLLSSAQLEKSHSSPLRYPNRFVGLIASPPSPRYTRWVLLEDRQPSNRLKYHPLWYHSLSVHL